MSQTDGAEEFDPKTGTFRRIRKTDIQPRRKAAAKPARPYNPALSEEGNRYGVAYEIFSHAAKSPAGTAAYRGAQVVIAIIFVMLIWEAVSYRMALGG
jgi:hypothetical protein